MPTFVLMVMLGACDREPKHQAERSDKLKHLEGRTLIAVQSYGSISECVHGRQDCPEVVEDQKRAQEKDRLTGKQQATVVSVRVSSGRIVDDKGFFHDGNFYFCSKCVQ